MSFTPEEMTYLASQSLARLATVNAGGQPDVVPVAFEFDGSTFWIGGGGESVLSTRKVRNVASGNRDVALVVDDMVSFDPIIARGIRVYGRAADPVNEPAWSGRASTYPSHPPPRGAGTWTPSRSARPGTQRAAPTTRQHPAPTPATSNPQPTDPGNRIELETMSKPATIDEYINTAPPLGHALLNELRTLCRDAAPDAVEQIKWGHPAYVHPDGVILFMFSGHKAHASFAFTPTTRAAFEAELTHYRTGKGTIALPYNTTPPRPLLTKMIKYRVREHEHDGVNWM